jgi:pimeloyl-ACP methyl ester carboxylesterase
MTHGQPSQSRDNAVRANERVIRVGSHHVPVSIQGEGGGVPLLMCNGVGAEYPLWGEFRQSLSRTTIAFDVRSAYLGGRPSMRTYAYFMRKVLDRLEYPTVDVLGLSWGGMAAQQFAHNYPERVRRLVLASTTPGFISVPARPSATLALLSPSRDAARMDRVIAKVYGGDFVETPELAAELGLIRRTDERAYRRQMLAIFGWTSVPWLHRIRHETLIMHADNDPVIPFVNSRLLRRLIPSSSLEVVPGGGHLYLYTRPQDSADLVNEFLARDSELSAAPLRIASRQPRSSGNQRR